jgi:integrase
MTHLEPAEVLSVLRAAKAKGAREWAMIVVAYKHGMRASEVCNLLLDDVDFKNGSNYLQFPPQWNKGKLARMIVRYWACRRRLKWQTKASVWEFSVENGESANARSRLLKG